jgi:hypothetical protein
MALSYWPKVKGLIGAARQAALDGVHDGAVFEAPVLPTNSASRLASASAAESSPPPVGQRVGELPRAVDGRAVRGSPRWCAATGP